MPPAKPHCQSCHSHTQAPTLSGREAETYINHACDILRSIYGLTPDNHPDPRLCSEPPPPLTKHLQGLYFPEPLATRQPTVSWYIANLSYYSKASVGVFHTALSYLERAKPRFKPIPADPRTAFVAALVLAHRFLEDGSYRTETWARLSGSSSRMISACVEAMFDALEHRLWIGPLPTPSNDRMFSMREGTIFSEEMLGGQRRCSLPSLSAIYGGAGSSSRVGSGVRAFGDPQGVPAPPPSIPAPATAPAPVAGPSTSTAALISKPAQGLPSPPASPASTSGTPPMPVIRVSSKPSTPARRVSVMSMPTSAPRPPPEAGVFDFTQWRAADAFQSRRSSVAPLPPPPHPPTQQPHPHAPTYVRRPSNPPPIYNLPVPAPRPIRGHDSPVFDVAQWCAPIPELAEDAAMSEPTGSEMEVEREVDSTPPRTPADGCTDTDAFNPRMWAAQATLFPPQASLVTPAPTVQVESPEKAKGIRYPSATLMPPSSCLDPAWNGRRHSIAVSGMRY